MQHTDMLSTKQGNDAPYLDRTRRKVQDIMLSIKQGNVAPYLDCTRRKVQDIMLSTKQGNDVA